MGLCRTSKRATPSAGADLISGLDDDVLLHILELLPDTVFAVRTGALSRRWRGLWTRLPTLRFDSGRVPGISLRELNGGAHRYVAFINDNLARCAAQTTELATVQHLVISFTMCNKLLPRFFRDAQGWIRDAVKTRVKSFVLELHRPKIIRGRGRCYANDEDNGNAEERQFVITLDDLFSSTNVKMETLRLALGGATVQVWLPTAEALTVLVDLSLENMEFMGHSSVYRLIRLLSSACCPRLQKLRLRKFWFSWVDDLLLESKPLRELSLEKIRLQPCTLRLRTPSLRVLRMVDCKLGKLMLSAPRLEQILFCFDGQPSSIEIYGALSRVRNLNVDLTSHAYRCDEDVDDHDNVHEEDNDDDDDNNNDNLKDEDEDDDDDDYDNDNDINSVGIRLLQCCTSATSLDLHLNVRKEKHRSIDMIEDRIPPLPQVTSLDVHVSVSELHSFGIGIIDILKQCSNLKYLRIDCTFNKYVDMKTNFSCAHQDNSKSYGIYIHLPHINEVEFSGLAGTECEVWFMNSILMRATDQLQKLSISFDSNSSLQNRRDAFESIPQLDDGMWTCTSCWGDYLDMEWERCPE